MSDNKIRVQTTKMTQEQLDEARAKAAKKENDMKKKQILMAVVVVALVALSIVLIFNIK